MRFCGSYGPLVVATDLPLSLSFFFFLGGGVQKTQHYGSGCENWCDLVRRHSHTCFHFPHPHNITTTLHPLPYFISYTLQHSPSSHSTSRAPLIHTLTHPSAASSSSSFTVYYITERQSSTLHSAYTHRLYTRLYMMR